MPSILKTYPEHQECSLPFHRAGSRVQWTQWDKRIGAMRVLRGTVTKHEGRVITAALDTGGVAMVTCGCVVAQ